MNELIVASKEATLNTVELYKKGLKEMKLSKNQNEMLKVHYAAPDRRITMTQMAQAVGYKGYSASNLHYGKIGRAHV
jgi:hypothetical protein